MRFTDIKQSIDRRLTEAANAGLEVQHALHDIDAIKKSVPNIPDEKSQEKNKHTIGSIEWEARN